MVRRTELEPRIVCNPNGIPLNLKPIEETWLYLEDLRHMSLSERMLKQQGYRTMQFLLQERNKKMRCARCHFTLRGKKKGPRRKKTTKEMDEEEEHIRQHTGCPDQDSDNETGKKKEETEEDLANRPMLIWVRPGKGMYKARKARPIEEPCDITWDEDPNERHWPEDPAKWCEPGAEVDKNAKNPWNIFPKKLEDGRTQMRDAKTANAKYTKEVIHMNLDGPDWAQEIVEVDEREYEKMIEQKGMESVCQSHPGKVQGIKWTCCGRTIYESGCVGNDRHAEDNWGPDKIDKYWELLETPWCVPLARDAVVLDCEMGINAHGDQELLRMSAIDYFTGEVLIDTLVWPSMPMLHLNTRYSGVSWPMLYRARETRNCVFGRLGALERLWEFVGRATTLIMHGGRADLIVLRWIHDRIIDTVELEGRRVQGLHYRTLKRLSAAHLKRQIQCRYGHDSLEDAMATRDLVHWYVGNLRPEDKLNPDRRHWRRSSIEEHWAKQAKEEMQEVEDAWLLELGRIEL